MGRLLQREITLWNICILFWLLFFFFTLALRANYHFWMRGMLLWAGVWHCATRGSVHSRKNSDTFPINPQIWLIETINRKCRSWKNKNLEKTFYKNIFHACMRWCIGQVGKGIFHETAVESLLLNLHFTCRTKNHMTRRSLRPRNGRREIYSSISFKNHNNIWLETAEKCSCVSRPPTKKKMRERLKLVCKYS